MRSACASRSGPGTKGRKSSFNLRRWTVNLRRPGRARNEGSTGPKRLGDTRYTFYQEPTVLLRPSAPQCPNTRGMIRPEELRGNSHIRACAALRQAFPWSLEPAGTRIRLDLPPLTSHSFVPRVAPLSRFEMHGVVHPPGTLWALTPRASSAALKAWLPELGKASDDGC